MDLWGLSPKDWWPWMNNRWILPKHLFIIWIIAHKRLLTQTRLLQMTMTTQVKCLICDDGQETVNHLFARCRYSRYIFAEIGDWCGIKLPEDDCINWWLYYKERSATKNKIVGVILAASIYNLWNALNLAKIDFVVKNQNSVICRIKNDVIRRIDHFETKPECPNIRGWIERLKMGGTG